MTENYVSGHAAGAELLKALGIASAHVHGVTIRAFVGEVLSITIDRYVTDDELVEVKRVLEAERAQPSHPGNAASQSTLEVTDFAQDQACRMYVREP